MKTLNYRQARPWLLAVETFVATGLTLCIAALLAGYGLRAAVLPFILVAVAAGVVATRNERLDAARRFARQDLDSLREELRQAAAGEGAEYEWVRTVPYRPAFTTLLSNAREEVGLLEFEARRIERTMRQLHFWQNTRSARQAWDAIGFQARRNVESISDSVFWRDANGLVGFSQALSSSHKAERGPRLQLVVVNRHIA